MEMQKVRLTQEKETLLVPLYSKAIQAEQSKPIIDDPKAKEILQSIDYDFAQLKIPRQSLLTLAMRAKRLDYYVKSYIQRSSNPLVLHLGCGLDSRVLRVAHTNGSWYDLDYPDVIELRRKFYNESEHYHMIASSVTDFNWIDQIVEHGSACIIAEGLVMYMTEGDVKQLITLLQARFPHSEMAFDAYSQITAKSAGRHPSIKKTGAVINWGIDDAHQIETWGNEIHLTEEWFFTDSNDIADMGLGLRTLFGIVKLFPVAKRAHRIIRLQL